MTDFRTAAERDADEQASRNRQNQEQADYKRMYETVLAENQALQARLGEIEQSFAQAVDRVSGLEDQFGALSAEMTDRYKKLLEMSESMQNTVATGYEQQTDLMERFRGDISQRLEKAQKGAPAITSGG